MNTNAATSTPCKIAFVITELDVGGAERALVQLVLGLPRDRWEPRVYSLGMRGPLVAPLEEAGIPVKTFDAVHLWSAPLVLWQLWRELKEFQPAILQSFLFHANLIGRLAGWAAGVPHRVSGIRVAERRGPWYGWLDWITNGLVEVNVCVSRGVADYCQNSVGLDPAKTVVIPNGINLESFAAYLPADATEIGLAAATPILLSVGRLEHQKGMDVLLDAFSKLKGPATAAHLIVIGSGIERPVLERQVQELGLAARIHFLGQRNDVPRWLKRACILVLASRWEGMPNVVLEAMAVGTPVIATQVEGIAELLQDGDSGLVVPPSDPQTLGAAIERLLEDPALCRRFAESAQRVAKKEYTISAMVRGYSDLYQRLLENHPAQTPKEQG